MLVKSSLLPNSFSLPICTVSKAEQPPSKKLFCPEDLKGTSITQFISSIFYTPVWLGQKKSILRVSAIPFPPESAYSVPDNAIWLRDPYPGMDTGVCCAVGKVQKLPSQMAVTQSDVRSFQDPRCASTTERSSLTHFLLDHSSCPFCLLAKGNLCRKSLNTQLEWMVICMLASHQSSEKPDLQQPSCFKEARLFLVPTSLQQDLILEFWIKVT